MENVETGTQAYVLAKERYAAWGVDTDAVLEQLAQIPVSLHCWQGDDVIGFENPDQGLDGGIMATGQYPGRARTPDELRMDADKAFSLIPGAHRFNLHAIYSETGGRRVDRDALTTEQFSRWIDWARARGLGLDFNPTFFSHPKAADGLTLSHPDPGIRQFWIDHGRACRRIGEAMGRTLGTPCITNVWVPDGSKDLPFDRRAPRERLIGALDALFSEKLNPEHNLDSVESKLFGIGAESYTVGSHEFYLAYAVSRGMVLCLDAGHFHPTEVISDKISAALGFLDRLLLHVSRPVRWDSDHVVILSDEVRAIAQSVIRGEYIQRVHIGLDFFDASINRVAAWVIGSRAMIKALLMALLEPGDRLRQMEREGDFTARLALFEALKTMPFAAVWDHYCERQGVPSGMVWMDAVRRYEKDVLSGR